MRSTRARSRSTGSKGDSTRSRAVAAGSVLSASSICGRATAAKPRLSLARPASRRSAGPVSSPSRSRPPASGMESWFQKSDSIRGVAAPSRFRRLLARPVERLGFRRPGRAQCLGNDAPRSALRPSRNRRAAGPSARRCATDIPAPALAGAQPHHGPVRPPRCAKSRASDGPFAAMWSRTVFSTRSSPKRSRQASTFARLRAKRCRQCG